MDEMRKRQLLMKYKLRKPEMGVICFRCTETADSWFYPSTDTKADLNSTRFKLNSGYFPNKELMKRWSELGEAGFEGFVAEALPYDKKKPDKDYGPELERLCEKWIEQTEKGARLKK